MDDRRLLTEDELNRIINSSINKINSISIKEIQQPIIDQIRFHLYESLKDVEINPNIIPPLINQIIMSYHSALVKSGKMVGPLATEAISGPLTQSALNSFHASGAIKTFNSGIKALRSLLEIPNVIKDVRSNIRFNQPVTNIDILVDKKKQLVEINLDDLVEDYDYLEHDGLIDTTSHLISKSPFEWYQNYFSIFQQEWRNAIDILRNSRYVLRLTIDGEILLSHNIDPIRIMNVISESLKEKKKSRTSADISPGSIIVIPSPIMVKKEVRKIITEREIINVEIMVPYMYLDFIINPRLINVKESQRENIELVKMERVIIDSMSEIQIKGVHNIKTLDPERVSVWSIVRNEIYSTQYDLWNLEIHLNNKKLNGITIEHLKNLIESCGMVWESDIPVDETVKDVWVSIPEDIQNQLPNTSPHKLFKHRLSQEDKLIADHRKQTLEKITEIQETDISISYNIPQQAIVTRNSYIYSGISDGSNLTILSYLSNIDFDHTYSSNLREIYNYLGIEAARTFLLRSLYQSINNGSDDINVHHLQLISDFQTFAGELTKIGYSGISNQTNEVFQQMSTQRPIEAIIKAASFSLEDPLQGVSGAITVGIPANIGDEYRRRQGLPTESTPSIEPSITTSKLDFRDVSKALQQLYQNQ